MHGIDTLGARSNVIVQTFMKMSSSGYHVIVQPRADKAFLCIYVLSKDSRHIS